MHISEVRKEVHNALLKYRSIEGAINSLSFERLWGSSTDEQRNELLLHVRLGNRDNVIQWVDNHPARSYGEMGTKQLKDIAKSRHIANYSRLDKVELIMALEEQDEKDRNA